MRKTKEDALKTKQTILSSALDCFSERGYFNTSLDEIAKQAGMTRGAVYWHFKNKPEIFNALHQQLHEPFMKIILQDLEMETAHPLEQLKKLLVEVLLDLEQNPTKTQMLRLFYQCDYSGDLAQFKAGHQASVARNLELMASYFERAIEKGQLSVSAKPRILTLTLHCFLKGILYEYLNGSTLIQMGRQTEQLINQLFVGLNDCHLPCQSTTG
jgi:AcrR family transcriptional regulator